MIPKRDLHCKKIMAIVFWDFKGIVHREYLPRGHTINSDKYCAILKNLDESIRRKRPEHVGDDGKCNIILQHDNAKPHVSKKTKEALAVLGWEVLTHPPYSPDLAPSDYHLFLSMANAQRGCKFANDEEAKQFSDSFFLEKEVDGVGDDNFFCRGILKLPERWRMCIAANGEFFDPKKGRQSSTATTDVPLPFSPSTARHSSFYEP